MAYTLEQLQQMGAKPVTPQGSYTVDDLQKMGAQPTAPQSPVNQTLSGIKDFAVNAGKNILRGPATMIARPLQLAEIGVGGLISKLTGNPKYSDEVWKEVNTPTDLVKPPSQETPESIAGEAASTVALGAVPGASAPVSGMIQGAVAGAGNAMQNNGSPVNVAANSVAGGALGYAGGKLTQGLISKIHGPDTLEESLFKAGAAADPVSAKTITQTLADNGISDLTDRSDIEFARNTLSNSLRSAQQALNDAPVLSDGSPTPDVLTYFNQVRKLQDALRATTQIGHYLNAGSHGLIKGLGAGSIGLGVGLGNIASDSIRNGASALYDKFIPPTPSFTPK